MQDSGRSLPNTTPWIDRLAAAWRAGNHLVLLFDFDGTLAPLVNRPWLARLPPGTRKALLALSTRHGITVGVVSSRALAPLKRLVGLHRCAYAGSSGLELAIGDRRSIAPGTRQARPLVRHVQEALESAAKTTAGAWVEAKPFGATLHWRGVPRSRVAALRDRAIESLRPHRSRVAVVPGVQALEATAALGWTKGTALRLIVRHVERTPRLLFYAGDSANDREAFAAARALHGIVAAVGRRAPRGAEVRFDDPLALGTFLTGLARACRE